MGLFDQFPYTNFHELNLDWILQALKDLEHTIDQFVSINALKYADPIQWNITRQYEKNTIVIDPLTGTAYISVQPVPSGVALTREEYWTIVFDLGSFVTRAAKNFTNRWESQWTLTATFPSSVGDWLVWNDTLFRVISNIVAGDQYVIDSNIRHFTIEDLIGHIEDLNTTDKSNLVAAINDVLRMVSEVTGDLEDLNTTDKSNLVAAINEVLQTLFNTTGNLEDLHTTDKSNLVAAINENVLDIATLSSSFNEYKTNNRFINAIVAGAKGDGTTDDTAILQSILDSGNNLYLPSGVYKITDTLNVADQLILGGGENTIISHFGSTPIIALGSRASLSHVKLQYDSSVDVSTASQFSDFAGIIIKSDLSTYPFQRSGIDHVIITHIGTGFCNEPIDGEVAFSVQLSNVEITEFSHCGICEYNSTGDLLSNVYVNCGVINPETPSADLRSADYGLYAKNVAHLILNNVNIEWGHYQSPILIMNSNIVGAGLHLEEVSTRNIYNGLITLVNSNLTIDALEFYYPWLYVEGTSLFKLINAGRHADVNAGEAQESVIKINNYYIEGLNSPDWQTFPSISKGLQYAGANWNMFLSDVTSEGIYYVDINNYNYTCYIDADSSSYENYMCYPTEKVIINKYGQLPASGAYGDRPTKRLYEGYRYYGDNTSIEYVYINGTWHRVPDIDVLTFTADANFAEQVAVFAIFPALGIIDIDLQGTMTDLIGTVGTLSSPINATGVIRIGTQLYGIDIVSGVVSISNIIPYDPADVPTSPWFKSTLCLRYK